MPNLLPLFCPCFRGYLAVKPNNLRLDGVKDIRDCAGVIKNTLFLCYHLGTDLRSKYEHTLSETKHLSSICGLIFGDFPHQPFDKKSLMKKEVADVNMRCN